MKKATTTKRTIINFEKCYELDYIYFITKFISKNGKDKKSKYWIAYFTDEKGFQHFEIYCESKLIFSKHSTDYNIDYDNCEDESEYAKILVDSLVWFSNNIGKIISDEFILTTDEYLESMNIEAKYGMNKPLVEGEECNYKMEDGLTLNTKLFTLNELKYKPFSKLYELIEGLKEIAIDIEDSIEYIEMLEEETGSLDNDMTERLNIFTTQLDYIAKNISTCIEALTFCEKETFVVYKEFNIFLN